MFQERDLKKAERRLRDECADKVHTEEEKHTLQEKTTELLQEIKRLRRKIHTLQRHTSVSMLTPIYLTQYQLSITHRISEI